MTTWLTDIPNEQWDNTLFARGGHFTQSSHWAAVQKALGLETFFAQGDGWQCLALLEKGKLGSRLYCPYGPTVTSALALDVCISALKQLAKQTGASYLRIEPIGQVASRQLQTRGLRRAPKDYQPRYTWVKDVTRPQTELLTEMTSTNRNLFNTATKKGLTFKASRDPADMSVFLTMMHQVAKRAKIHTHSDHKFQTIARTLFPRKAATLYIANQHNTPVACALVYDSPTTRYYAHAASDYEARKLHPGSPLLSTMIFDAKANGQTSFDFFGIAPPDQRNHQWSGFTHFKQSFGGELKEYLGTWELPTKHLRYAAYRLAHKAKGMLR